MTVYFLIGLFLVIASFMEMFLNLSKKISRWIFLLFSFLLAVLSSVRWETGTDWGSYLLYFNNRNNGIFRTGAEDFEIGYRVLNSMIRFFGGSYTALLTVLAFIVFFAQSRAVLYFADVFKEKGIYQRYCPNTILMCMWFIHLGNVFTTRSVVAYTILFYSLKYVHLKDFKRFLFFIILAASIHQTSLFYLIAYPIFHSDWKIIRKAYLLLPAAAAVFAVSSRKILTVLCTVLPESFAFRIRFYMETMIQESGLTGLVNFILLYMIFFILRYWYFKANRTYDNFFNLYCAGIIPYLTGVTISAWFIRAAVPYMMITVLLLPIVLRPAKKRGSRIIFFLILIFYLLLRFRSNIYQYYDLYVPYKSVFAECLDGSCIWIQA